MDLVRYELFDGTPFWLLTAIDEFSRQITLLEPRFSLPGRDIVAALDRAIE